MEAFLKPGVGTRLKEERERLGLSQTAFARLANTSKSTQIRYESGEGSGLDMPYLGAIQAAGADVEYLLTGRRAAGFGGEDSKMEPVGEGETALVSPARKTDNVVRFDSGPGASPRPYPTRSATTRLPYYDIRAAAGPGQVNESGLEEVDAFEVPTNWLRNDLGIDPSRALVMKVIGDSMEPHIRSGELVIVDRAASSLKTDGIYVFEHGDVTLIKRLQRIHGQGVKVISENSTYPTYLVPESNLSELRVVGRVAFFGRLT